MSIKGKSKLRNRVVAFIDILGFSELMNKIDGGNFKTENAIFESLIRTKAVANLITRESAENHADFQMTAFSDSIVLSIKPQNFFPLMMAVHSHAWSLLKIGLLCRGAITLGPIYHQNSVIFGNGLVSAYSLESKVAIHPRIIISDEFHNKILEFEKKPEISSNIASNCLLQDSDGVWFIDPFIFPKNKEAKENFIDDLLYRKHIIEGLLKQSNLDNISILSKYRWLAFRFNSSISKSHIDIEPIEINSAFKKF